VRPAYVTISAVVMGVGASVLGILDVIDDMDAALTLGFAGVLAIVGLKER
jgi:hypothetical protein